MTDRDNLKVLAVLDGNAHVIEFREALTVPLAVFEGAQLRYFRAHNGLGQKELSELLEVEQHEVSFFERGVKKMPADVWARFELLAQD